jgi:hypothetical protein
MSGGRWESRLRFMASTSFLYVETDVPDGVTLTQWRRDRIAQAEPRSAWRLFRRHAPRGQSAAAGR